MRGILVILSACAVSMLTTIAVVVLLFWITPIGGSRAQCQADHPDAVCGLSWAPQS